MEPSADRVRVTRIPERGAYDAQTLHAILDAGLIAHVGIVQDGQPFVIPMLYGRAGQRLFLHGATSSRLMRTLADGAPACVTVTRIDGLVLARSAFHHSANYRSAVVLGRLELLAGQEKLDALRAISEQVIPGRWDEVRGPNEKELRATAVVAMSLAEASCKVRTGGPGDEPEDYALKVWAGVIPLRQVADALVPDERLAAGIEPSACVRGYRPPR